MNAAIEISQVTLTSTPTPGMSPMQGSLRSETSTSASSSPGRGVEIIQVAPDAGPAGSPMASSTTPRHPTLHRWSASSVSRLIWGPAQSQSLDLTSSAAGSAWPRRRQRRKGRWDAAEKIARVLARPLASEAVSAPRPVRREHRARHPSISHRPRTSSPSLARREASTIHVRETAAGARWRVALRGMAMLDSTAAVLAAMGRLASSSGIACQRRSPRRLLCESTRAAP